MYLEVERPSDTSLLHPSRWAGNSRHRSLVRWQSISIDPPTELCPRGLSSTSVFRSTLTGHDSSNSLDSG